MVWLNQTYTVLLNYFVNEFSKHWSPWFKIGWKPLIQVFSEHSAKKPQLLNNWMKCSY